MALISAWTLIPAYVVMALVAAASLSPARTRASGGVTQIIESIVPSLALALATMAIVVAYARIIDPTPSEASEPLAITAYGEAAGRIPAMIGLGVLFGLTVIPLLFVFPLGIYLWVRYSVTHTAIIAQKVGPIEGLRRSWALTRGNWWHTAVVLFLSGMAILIIEVVILGVFGAGIAVLLATSPVPLISAILSAIMQCAIEIVVVPFSTAIPVVLFFELRARAEGYDLERRILQASLPA